MTEDLSYKDAVQATAFTVYADPPWLLHLSGELDLDTAPELSVALEDSIRLGGTIGLDLAELTYMDSSGIRVIFNTVRLLGERGRVVLFNASPIVRRLLEMCGLDGTLDINDGPPPHQQD